MGQLEKAITDLAHLGFNPFFQQQAEPDKVAQFQIARVSAVDKESYLLLNHLGEVRAEIAGKLMFSADSALDYPTTGDWVYAHYLDNDTFAIINDVLPRRSLLKRKTAGKKIGIQLVAANIDTAFVIQSLDHNFNLRRLERYLVMVHESHVEPVVLLSKSDLCDVGEVADRMGQVEAMMPDLKVVAFSNMNPSGLDRVRALLTAGRTYCLLGSSGVGKTTLLNNLLTEEVFRTQPIRKKDSKGRHTTTRRQITLLNNGALLVDTPGMRELGHIGVEAGLAQTFDELTHLAGQCRFSDCSHTREAGCAILAAVEKGDVANARYHSYIKLAKEAAHHEMSYLEKRRKDKAFGKMVKDAMKHKKGSTF